MRRARSRTLTLGRFPRATRLGPIGLLVLLLLALAWPRGAAASITEYAVPTADSVPHGIALGQANSIWFAEYLGNQVGQLFIATADLSITKTDGVTTATPGGSVTYTITATNAGPSNATGATVADTFPASADRHLDLRRRGRRHLHRQRHRQHQRHGQPARGRQRHLHRQRDHLRVATGTLSNTATVTAPGGRDRPDAGQQQRHRHRHARRRRPTWRSPRPTA